MSSVVLVRQQQGITESTGPRPSARRKYYYYTRRKITPRQSTKKHCVFFQRSSTCTTTPARFAAATLFILGSCPKFYFFMHKYILSATKTKKLRNYKLQYKKRDHPSSGTPPQMMENKTYPRGGAPTTQTQEQRASQRHEHCRGN